MHFYYEDFTGIPEKAKMIKLTAAVTAGTETARGIVQRSWSRDRNQWEELSRVRNAWKQRIPRIWRIKFNLSVYLSMILKIKSIQCTSIVSYSFYVFLRTISVNHSGQTDTDPVTFIRGYCTLKICSSMKAVYKLRLSSKVGSNVHMASGKTSNRWVNAVGLMARWMDLLKILFFFYQRI